MADQPLDYEACSPDQREVALDRLLTEHNALLDEAFRVILASDALEDFRADGALTMADWLAYRFNISHSTARRWVRAAKALEELPLIRARFVAGEVSFEQLSHALTFATPADDARLARLLPALSCADIEAMARQRRRARRRDHDTARRLTHLRIRPDSTGLGSRVTGFLANEDAAVVEAALNRRAETAGPDPETGHWSPHPQRMAEGLRDMCAEDLARGVAEGSEPDSAMVVVHAPASLLDADRDVDAAATINGRPITNDALRRLLCDCRHEVHYDSPDGVTVGVGRATRNPPSWLRRRILGRDHRRCRWPGCGRASRHLHHMQHWTQGGPTDASNLMSVCWHHHHLLHEGGWHATGNADHHITITSPYGRTLDSRPGPMAA